MAETEAVAPPEPTTVLAEDHEIARVERWAQRRQAVLEHLAAELAALRRAGPGPVTGPPIAAEPTAHLPVVDELLRAASERLAGRTAEAIADADALVADAVREATEVLLAGGLPGSRLRTRDPLLGLLLATRSARPAAELWRQVSGDVAHPPSGWDPPRHSSTLGGPW